MRNMKGPWYTLEEATQKLGLSRSELIYLIAEKEVLPTVHTKARSFLLFRHNNNGWTGRASCQYRGHLVLHHNNIMKLMDNEELYLNTGSCLLLEQNGILSWSSSYPFAKPLPHDPLTEWIPTDQDNIKLPQLLATPLPKEAETGLSAINRGLKAYKKAEGLNDLTQTSHLFMDSKPLLSLLFKENSLFIPDNLRIPASEINRYQQIKSALTTRGPKDQKRIEPVKERENQLHTLIERIVIDQPKVSAKKAWRLIENDCELDEPLFDHDGILMRVDDKCIEWRSRHGREQSLKYRSFCTQLGKIKKQITLV